MQGIMFTAKGVAQIIDEPMPDCGRDQVLLKTLHSAVSNGTERSFLTGGPYGGQKWPNRIGYLTVARVVEAGAEVVSLRPGDVVYTGTFCGHVAYHTAKEGDLIVKLPPGLDLRAATMLGLAGVAYFNAVRVGVEAGDRVLVTGAGGIGLMALQAAKELGARVTLASRTACRRALGIDMGADAAYDPDGEGLAGDGPYSVLLECAGAGLDDFMGGPQPLLARFGRVALVAGRSRVEYDFLKASMLRVSFYQSTHFDRPTLEKVTSLAADGRLDLGALVQEVLPLEKAVGLYERLRDEPLAVGGTVFDWPV